MQELRATRLLYTLAAGGLLTHSADSLTRKLTRELTHPLTHSHHQNVHIKAEDGKGGKQQVGGKCVCGTRWDYLLACGTDGSTKEQPVL